MVVWYTTGVVVCVGVIIIRSGKDDRLTHGFVCPMLQVLLQR